MIWVIIRMKAPSDKRMELSQAIVSLLGPIRAEKGCNQCDFYQDIGDENKLCLLEQWDNRENLKSHIRSKHFGVLRGAMNLLKEPYELILNNAARSMVIEDICV
jgi:quinol monooxygenase YgiN